MEATKRRRQMLVEVMPTVGLTAAVFAVGMVAGLAGRAIVDRVTRDDAARADRPAAECGADTEPLHIAADEAVVPIVRQLAERYSSDLPASERACVAIAVHPVTSSAVVGRLTNGWRSSTHGPRPDVWIPKSTMWVELLRAQVDDPTILSDDPTIVARSPTVLAMPRPMAEQLGWPDRELRWGDIFALADADAGWADADRPEWGAFRLELSDPRYTTTGLQTLLALDTARTSGERAEMSTPLSLFQVQRALADIAASSAEILSRYASADEPLRALSATPLEERELSQFNRTGSSSAHASERSGRPTVVPELVAWYPSGGDILMESDYPYVVLRESWVGDAETRIATDFLDHLSSDVGTAMFVDAGFRDSDNRPGPVLRGDDALPAPDAVAQRPPGALPDVNALRQLRSSWVIVPRVSRTLFLIDVSGSMVEPVGDTGQTRLQATVSAAEQSLQIIPTGSAVGLWEFSTNLKGGEHGGDYRELVPIGPLDEMAGGRSRRDRLTAALRDITPQHDTALNDSLLAAYQRLRADYTPGRRHLIVLLTDGRNDDADSISHAQLISRLRRLHRAQEPIEVVSIAYGEQPDIDKLAEISEMVGGRVLASPALRRLDRLFIEALAR